MLRQWTGSIAAGISPQDAQVHCVQHADWQRVRLYMKGKTTEEKLDICKCWYDNGFFRVTNSREADFRIRDMQVANYLGALRRGGQLDMDNKIRKER